MLSKLKKFYALAFCSVIFLSLIAENAFSVVRISNMNNFSFGNWPGVGDLVASDGICIYDSVGGGGDKYNLRATGSGAGGAFTLSTVGATLPYSVTYLGSSGAKTTLIAGVTDEFKKSDTTSSTCGGGTNGTLEITILETDMALADGGTYSGVLTLLLTP